MSKVLSAALAAACIALAGCNTVSGIGQDIKAGGEKITGASETVSGKMGSSKK